MTIKEKIYLIVDDRNIKTNKYSALFNYSVLILIIISVLEIILEVDPKFIEYYKLFNIINDVTIGLFTIEYALRFWVSTSLNDKYKGFRGKVKYFFSFYNLIDFIAIIPFYISFLISGTAISVFKVLRVVRVLRILRYVKSFSFVVKSMGNKKRELFVSMQVLFLFTFVLSVFMYNVENKAQPENFGSIWDAVLWSISKFIGGIGGYGDFSPITSTGKILATIIGILAIAFFALPAGIIASGFVEEIETEKRDLYLKEQAKLIASSFKNTNVNKDLGIVVSPKYRTFAMLQARLNYSDHDIYTAIRYSDNLRVKWDKSTPDSKTFDMVVIEHFEKNRPYGLLEKNIDEKNNRGSDINIICAIGRSERAFSHLSRTLARYGKFNLVVNECFSKNDIIINKKIGFDPSEYYVDNSWNRVPEIKSFCDDIISISKNAKYNIILRSAASKHSNQFHFLFGGEKGDNINDVKNPTVDNIEEFISFYNSTKTELEIKGYKVGTNEFFGHTGDKSLHRCIYKNTKTPTITIFISIVVAAVAMSDKTYLQNIKLLADSINKFLSRSEE